MATATLVTWCPQFVSRIVDAYRAWQWGRMRYRCDCCGQREDWKSESEKLFSNGHYRAAVFTARLRLETALVDLTHGLPGADGRFGRHYIPLLLSHGRITAQQANRANAVYRRASRIVHGGPCG